MFWEDFSIVRFVVSGMFTKPEVVRRMGSRYLALLPGWVKDSPQAQCVVVIAPSTDNAESVKRSIVRKPSERVVKIVFSGQADEGYVDLFTHLLKECIDSNPQRSQVFHHHLQSLVKADDLLLPKDVARTLSRHLVLYFLKKGELLKWNQERFILCEQIMQDINALVLPHGALQ